MGLYRAKPIAVPIPNSAKFKNPNILLSVEVRPTNSSPRKSKNIFLEKNWAKTDIRKKKAPTCAFFIDLETLDILSCNYKLIIIKIDLFLKFYA